MRNLGKALVAVAAAAALCAGLPTVAQAARGVFVYSVNGYGKTLNDPQDNWCYNTAGNANKAINHTNSIAVLYNGEDCHDGAVVTFVEPGQEAPDFFGSVKFLST